MDKLPHGWEVKTLNSITTKIGDGIHATPKYTNFSSIYFINGNNLKDNKIIINDKTKFVDEIDAQKHFRDLSDRTILMSINGTIGNLAYYQGEKIVLGKSACYINVDKNNDVQFIYYLLSSNFIKNFYQTELTGSTIKNLSLKTIKATKLPLPPLAEQTKIAEILSTWDNAIHTAEKLLTNNNKQKKALTQQLLTGKKRLKDKNGVEFCGAWEKIELGKLLNYTQPTKYLVKSTEYNDNYKTPVLTAGKTFILGYTNEEKGIYQDNLPVIIFDDFTTASKFVNFPFKVKSSAMKLLTNKDGYSIKYIFETMQILKYKIGGHQRHWISIFSNLIISVPPLEEQQTIAQVLTTADQQIDNLKQQISKLKTEKKALMQVLLIGKIRVNP